MPVPMNKQLGENLSYDLVRACGDGAVVSSTSLEALSKLPFVRGNDMEFSPYMRTYLANSKAKGCS